MQRIVCGARDSYVSSKDESRGVQETGQEIVTIVGLPGYWDTGYTDRSPCRIFCI